MSGPHPPALLVLEDGTIYRGRSVGAPGERACELVFNTAMSGYQEILTDPSYRGQGVVMTYPQIGNYGTAPADDESNRCWAEVLVMRQLSPVASNFRSTMPLGDYLREHEVPAIDSIDTRDITLRLREGGALRAVLSTEDLEPESLLAKARSHPSTEGRNLAAEVTCQSPYDWEVGFSDIMEMDLASQGRPIPLVAYDFGIKRNILRCLVEAGFSPTVVPSDTPARMVLERGPAAVFLSNGPGDPSAVDGVFTEIRQLADSGIPIFGICLGHQILAHVFGAKTEKMKFGHHGANHPVIELATGKVNITSQNHSYAVDADSLGATGLRATHRNGNDQTVEGMEHTELPVWSVQYHPEASPGPHDAAHLFRSFHERVVSRGNIPSCS